MKNAVSDKTRPVRLFHIMACTLLVGIFLAETGVSASSLVMACLIAAPGFVALKRTSRGATGDTTVVFESCRALNIDYHEEGCDADVCYEACTIMKKGPGSRKTHQVIPGGDIKRVALFLRGPETLSSWRSKLDSTVIEGLSDEEMKGAVSMIVLNGTFDVKLNISQENETDVSLTLVEVESRESLLRTGRKRERDAHRAESASM